MIIKKNLKPKDISFLQSKQTLYVSDFRAISESTEYEIPAMWKYENLLPWILSDKDIAVNESYLDLKYPFKNRLLAVPRGKDPRKSIFNKLSAKSLSGISSLWVAIPHPVADEFAKQHKLKINYSYSDFLKRNDKFEQKKLFGNLTPKWQIIRSKNDLEKLISKKGFIKRRHGSGGYTVFDANEAEKDENFLKLFVRNPADWFFEEFVEGNPCSIQCAINGSEKDIIIFGFSKQEIENSKNFLGSDILPLKGLQGETLKQLRKGIMKLKPLLCSYKGFFGIDFIINKRGTVYILEANIRITAATIPTLLTNMVGSVQSSYREDVPSKKVADNDIILTSDEISGTKDILRFYPNKGFVGKFFFLDFRNCNFMPKELNQNQIEDLANHIQNSVCGVVDRVVYNFWPFGWTACFILEESHCVISGWYLEKRVLINVFCCNPEVKSKKLKENLIKFFIPESTAKTKEWIR